MLKNFYKWYTKRLKKKPLIVVTSSIVTLFAAFSSIYGGAQAFGSFYNFIYSHYFENQILYEKLEKINTGLNIDFVESVIGKPVITKKLPLRLTEYIKTEDGEWTGREYPSGLEAYIEKIFIHKKYFLQLIVNNEGLIVSYAVTIKDPNFNPKIPNISNLRLGKLKLVELKDEPESINIGNWGMNHFYMESHYYGNPGFYKYYLLSFSPSGCSVDESTEYELAELNDEADKSITNKRIAELRSKIIPNAFAVIRRWEDENLLKYFIKEGVGVNYYDIREFN